MVTYFMITRIDGERFMFRETNQELANVLAAHFNANAERDQYRVLRIDVDETE